MATVDELKRVRKFVDGEARFGDAPPPGCRITLDVLDLFIGEAKRAEERRELEAFGEDVRVAAAAGWDALRVKNPKVDREDGAGNEIRVFEDLPHKVKLNYLTFTAGALYAGFPQRVALGMSGAGASGGSGRGTNLYVAPAGTALPVDPSAPLEGFESVGAVENVEFAEPVRFAAGDKAKVTGPPVSGEGHSSGFLNDGDIVTIYSGHIHDSGDMLVDRIDGGSGWILATSLTKVTEAVRLKEGDRVKITGPKQTAKGYSRENLLRDAESGTVIVETDEVGYTRIQADTGMMAWIAATSLTKLDEPRTWNSLEEIPEDVQQVTDDLGDPLKRDKSRILGWACGCALDPSFEHSISSDDWGPYTEVQS